MKKIVLTLIFFASLANVSAQLKVTSSGNVGIGKDPLYKLDVYGDIYMEGDSNILGTTDNKSIMFKVNNVLSGYTGNSASSNVSFGFGSLPNPSSAVAPCLMEATLPPSAMEQ